MRYAYLENTTSGHNKFYEMTENPGGTTFKARWGKIGTHGSEKDYSIREWTKKYGEKINKGYIDLTHTKSTPKPPFEINKKHLEKINKVYTILNINKNDIDGSHEYLRDVGAIRKTIKDPESPQNGNLSKEDMIYLNDLWKKIRHYAKEE